MKPAFVLLISVFLLGGFAASDVVETRPFDLERGMRWSTLEVSAAADLPRIDAGWEARIFWDLRPAQAAARRLDWIAVDPVTSGLARVASNVDTDLAVCRSEGEVLTNCRIPPQATSSAVLRVGERFSAGSVDGLAVAEGIALVPAGPHEVVLLREVLTTEAGTALRYRFVTTWGETAALFEGPVPPVGMAFVPDRGELLAVSAVDDGIEIPYQKLSDALVPGTTGFLQYSIEFDTALSSVDPGWTSVSAMIDIDSTSVAYQPDPGDPSTATTLPEVWDFTNLQTSVMEYRTFNTTRDDLAGNLCGASSCSSRDVGPNPPDGTWQSYLKIDNYDPAGTLFTRDIFDLNDNDTGADPSIDVPYVAQDELNSSDRTQLCFEDSAGGADRFLQFFQFFGPTPASAVLGVGDTWTSGNWTSCSNANGLKLTAASICGSSSDVSYCAPSCPDGIITPRARGLLGGGAGFGSQILDDGWMHMATGNYIPALLMRQDTDLQAGANLLGTCNLGTQRNRAFDYFWLNEDYGLMALVSSPADVDPYNTPGNDWTALGNVTDGADFTWGPFPPWQFEAEACLAGTRVSWALPADGSNLDVEPNVSDYGYVVSWGTDPDPEVLADWDTNPNRTPKPGDGGFLAAPDGSEPTSYTITGWAGSSINATVVTALRYTDPDVGDTTSYRSAAFHKVVENPAKLDAETFRVGTSVAPFVFKSGSDASLSWPAVAGAESYLLRVYDIDLDVQIPCPAGLDCAPTTASAIHSGALASSVNYGYRVTAVDPCGEESVD